MTVQEISKERTVGIIGPEALEQKAAIMRLVKKAQLKVVLETHVTSDDTLPSWIPSTPACVFVLEGINAVQRWLEAVGPEDISRARKIAPRSIRALYGPDSCYASKSVDSAAREIEWFQANAAYTPTSLSSASSASQGEGVRTAKSATATTKAKTKLVSRKEAEASKAATSSTARQRTQTTTPAKTGNKDTRTTTTPKPASAQIKKAALNKSNPAKLQPNTGESRPTSKAAVVEKKLGVTKPVATRSRKTSMSLNGVNKQSASGGVSKNTPPISVLTGRTRKYSRTERRQEVDETRKGSGTVAAPEPPALEKTDKLVSQSLGMTQSGDTSVGSSEKDDTESEHDAEVAAAVLASHANRRDSTSSLARGSFSPGSVTSLPRPLTPEVDQLRLRFETLSHSPVIEKRQSMVSPEIMLRIKELKPKGPIGTRVKSMVEFFMDESRHQWEF